jgi:LPS-assembly protein
MFSVVFFASLARSGPLSVRGDTDLPYCIKADTLTYDDVTKTYRARGSATITRADQSLHADAIDFHEETKDAEAWGDVRFFSGKDWLTGNRIEVNIEKGTGTLYNGTLFIEESHFYVRGDKIHKTGKDSYHIEGTSRFTTCDGDSPDWEITGKDLRVTLEGYGTVKHAAFRAKSIPVLYAPFIVFPAKIRRQTGLLVPQVLYSNMSGFEYIQPFFWAISESSDATFYEHYMEHRGLKHGLEYRYMLAPESKGAAMYDFLYDRQIDDGTPEPEDSSGYHYEGFRGDSEDRLNRKRWWFRMKSDWSLPAGFNAKLDADIVSDQDYLREFDSGYSSYDQAERYFLKEFGRGLDDKTDTVRLNQLNLNRSWDQFSLNADIRWYDDVITRKHDRDDTTLQNLPSVTFSGSKQKISDSPLYFDLATSFEHFWREVGTKGYSVDLYPRVYWPVSLLRCFDFEPSVGFRDTLWQVEAYETESLEKEDQLQSRELYDLKADLSTEISRVFDVGGATIDKIRHAIRPQVVYTYVPEEEQDDLPDFVSTIDGTNVVTYAVINTFTARKTERVKGDTAIQREAEAWAADFSEQASEAESQEESQPPKYTYFDFCRVTLSQSYDIDVARHAAPDGGKRRPFSDITGRLELNPFNCLGLVGNATWSPYDGEYKSYDVAVTFRNERGDWASADYRYTLDSSESIFSKVFVNLFDPISAYWEHEHNLKDSKQVKSVLGFQYAPQCWSFGVSYTDDRTANKYEYLFEISLYGLGEQKLGKYSPE